MGSEGYYFFKKNPYYFFYWLLFSLNIFLSISLKFNDESVPLFPLCLDKWNKTIRINSQISPPLTMWKIHVIDFISINNSVKLWRKKNKLNNVYNEHLEVTDILKSVFCKHNHICHCIWKPSIYVAKEQVNGQSSFQARVASVTGWHVLLFLPVIHTFHNCCLTGKHRPHLPDCWSWIEGQKILLQTSEFWNRVKTLFIELNS